MSDAVQAVISAIRDPGSHPDWHREVMARHRAEWPTLWRALDQSWLSDTPEAT